jgi:DNA-binding IclR family transcriptional regulator
VSRKRQITDLLAKQPMTTRDIARALGIKVSAATVYVAGLRRLELVKPVDEVYSPGRQRTVIVWGLT